MSALEPALTPLVRTQGGWRLPTLPNLHSHAFQRAMAGLAERRTDPADSFWTWRETMYRFASRMTPDTLRAVAAQLYVEMLEAGYGAVCEFHYVHHQPDGTPYADPAQMALALVEAARATGIRLTLLPVLYMTGGFDARPLSARQRRFGHDVEGYLRLVERLRPLEDPSLQVGLCFHSLRAVPGAAMQQVLDASPADMRIHLHIAEQQAEVADCLAVHGARPVDWLHRHFEVGPRWTLVHATHLSDAECDRTAASGATVALCPTTEANLGDGLFPLRRYLNAGGRWGVGSDSHVSVSPVEELRWLEYGQRLAEHRRNVAAGVKDSVGESLLAGAMSAGVHATGLDLRGDWLELDAHAPLLAGAQPGDVVDRWIFAGNRPLVRHVEVAGRQVVIDGRHVAREQVARDYHAAIDTLLRA